MNKILQATSRGQITLPKNWREKFDTNYFQAVVEEDSITIKPIYQEKSFKEKVEDAWQQYRDGHILDQDELKRMYGL